MTTDLFQLTSQIAHDIKQNILSHPDTAQTWHSAFGAELSISHDYAGREILELLQNADDAGSPHVAIRLRGDTLNITNSGEGTSLFTPEGFRSIMQTHDSSKIGFRAIGCKGLGFRSILNWSNDISIISGNVEMHFSEDSIRNIWNELAAELEAEVVEKYMNEARGAGRSVPLPILSLPKIASPIAPTLSPDSTSISIKIRGEKSMDSIRNQLQGISNLFLLFMNHIERLEVDMDGVSRSYTKRRLHPAGSLPEGISLYELNDCRWIMASIDGEMPGEDSKSLPFGCAAAIPEHFLMDGSNNLFDANQYLTDVPGIDRIHCYFPTDVRHNLPCLIHATLNLNSSRKQILDSNRENDLMPSYIAKAVKILADYILSRTISKPKRYPASWLMYRLTNPANSLQDPSFVAALYNKVRNSTADMAVIPTLSKRYAMPKDTCFYTDEFYTLVSDRLGSEAKSQFSDMRLPGDFLFLETPQLKEAEFARRAIEIAKALAEGRYWKRLALFIEGMAEIRNLIGPLEKVVEESETPSLRSLNLPILPDQNGHLIASLAFINSGRKMDFIPSCRKFSYVNDRFVKEMLQQLPADFDADEKVPNRRVARRLQLLCNVTYSDIYSVTRKLLPTKEDGENVEQLIRALYRAYDSDRNAFHAGVRGEGCYLPSISKNPSAAMRKSTSMIMGADGFPDSNLLTMAGTGYRDEHLVMYPQFLHQEGADTGRICDFLSHLGVNTLTIKSHRGIWEFHDYAKSVIADKRNPRLNSFSENTHLYVETEHLKNTNLFSLLRIIAADKVLLSDLASLKTIYYKEGHSHQSKSGQISLATWKLRQLEAMKPLRYFALEEERFLPGIVKSAYEVGIRELLHHPDYRHLLPSALRNLGAKVSFSDFSAEELYEALANLEKVYPANSYSGIKQVYHDIKNALDDVRPPVSGPVIPLSLLACRGGEYKYMPSGEIYYSDNESIPATLHQQVPLLVMKSREGGEKVCRLFGVRPLSELQCDITHSVANNDIAEEFQREAESIKAVVFAISKDMTRNLNAESALARVRLLRTIRIVPLRELSYKFQGVAAECLENEWLRSSASGNEYLLKTNHSSINEAWENPHFCMAVAEIFAVALKLSSDALSQPLFSYLNASELQRQFQIERFIRKENLAQYWRLCNDHQSSESAASEASSELTSELDGAGCPNLNREVDLEVDKEVDREIDREWESEVEPTDDNEIPLLPIVTLKNGKAPQTRPDQKRKWKGTYSGTPDEVRMRLGRNSELAVIRALKESGEYTSVVAMSSLGRDRKGGNGKAVGNDGAGFDLVYRKVVDGRPGPLRCLEVKHKAGGWFFLTANELATAHRLRDRYDIALVSDTIRIYEAPFNNPGCFRIKPKDYRVKLGNPDED